MNTKIIIAAAAAASLLLSTGAFAASEDYPANTNNEQTVVTGNYVSTQSSEAYPTFSPALSSHTLSQPYVAQNNGSESSFQSVNFVPKNFDVGTQE